VTKCPYVESETSADVWRPALAWRKSRVSTLFPQRRPLRAHTEARPRTLRARTPHAEVAREPRAPPRAPPRESSPRIRRARSRRVAPLERVPRKSPPSFAATGCLRAAPARDRDGRDDARLPQQGSEADQVRGAGSRQRCVRSRDPDRTLGRRLSLARRPRGGPFSKEKAHDSGGVRNARRAASRPAPLTPHPPPPPRVADDEMCWICLDETREELVRPCKCPRWVRSRAPRTPDPSRQRRVRDACASCHAHRRRVFEPKRRFSNCSSLGSGGRRTAVKKPAGSLARARFFFSHEEPRVVESSSRARVRLTLGSRARPSHRLAFPHSEPLRSTASASRAGSSSAAASRRSRVVSFASRCYPTGARLFSATSSRTTRRLGAAVPTAAAARRPARLSVPRPAARPLRRRPTPRGTSAGRVRGRVRIRTTRLSRRGAGRWTR
jgi:hypothetical protein